MRPRQHILNIDTAKTVSAHSYNSSDRNRTPAKLYSYDCFHANNHTSIPKPLQTRTLEPGSRLRTPH